MADLSKARFVELQLRDGHYVLVLYDGDRKEIGFGYKGPTAKRAEADLKYWTRAKGLQQLPPG